MTTVVVVACPELKLLLWLGMFRVASIGFIEEVSSGVVVLSTSGIISNPCCWIICGVELRATLLIVLETFIFP